MSWLRGGAAVVVAACLVLGAGVAAAQDDEYDDDELLPLVPLIPLDAPVEPEEKTDPEKEPDTEEETEPESTDTRGGSRLGDEPDEPADPLGVGAPSDPDTPAPSEPAGGSASPTAVPEAALSAELTPTEPSPKERRGLLGRWWVWAIVGVAAVGATGTAVALSQPEPELPFDTLGTMDRRP